MSAGVLDVIDFSCIYTLGSISLGKSLLARFFLCLNEVTTKPGIIVYGSHTGVCRSLCHCNHIQLTLCCLDSWKYNGHVS